MKVAVVIVLDEDGERYNTHAFVNVNSRQKASYLAAKAETEVLMGGMDRRHAKAIVRETLDFHVAIINLDGHTATPTPGQDGQPLTVVVLP